MIIIPHQRLECSIWPIHGTLTGTTTQGQRVPGSNGNKGVLHILQNTRTGASPSDAVSCNTQDTHWSVCVGGCYPTSEVQAVYSIALTDRVERSPLDHINMANMENNNNK